MHQVTTMHKNVFRHCYMFRQVCDILRRAHTWWCNKYCRCNKIYLKDF